MTVPDWQEKLVRDLAYNIGISEAQDLTPIIVDQIRPHIEAAALRAFADAHRFPSSWVMFRREDGSGVTVSDLLRETADRIAEGGTG